MRLTPESEPARVRRTACLPAEAQGRGDRPSPSLAAVGDRARRYRQVPDHRSDERAILAYRQSVNGELTPVPGSPFATRVRGVFDTSLKHGPFNSDQVIVTSADKTLLFAVNAGSNTVAVFLIHCDGSLSHVEGSPCPSGGLNPVSVGVSRDTLVVVHKAMDPQRSVTSLPNYTSFHFSADRRVDAIPLSSSTALTLRVASASALLPRRATGQPMRCEP